MLLLFLLMVGQIVATGSDDGIIRLWHTTDGEMVDTLPTGERAGIDSISYSPDGSILASSSTEINLWRLSDKQLLHTFSEKHMGRFESVKEVVFSPNGKLIACVSENNIIGLRRVEDGSLVKMIEKK